MLNDKHFVVMGTSNKKFDQIHSTMGITTLIKHTNLEKCYSHF